MHFRGQGHSAPPYLHHWLHEETTVYECYLIILMFAHCSFHQVSLGKFRMNTALIVIPSYSQTTTFHSYELYTMHFRGQDHSAHPTYTTGFNCIWMLSNYTNFCTLLFSSGIIGEIQNEYCPHCHSILLPANHIVKLKSKPRQTCRIRRLQKKAEQGVLLNNRDRKELRQWENASNKLVN